MLDLVTNFRKGRKMKKLDSYSRELMLPVLKSVAVDLGQTVNLTELEIRELWTEQKGKCAYSGVSLQIPNLNDAVKNSYSAYLQPKDFHKPYDKDNLELVSGFVFTRLGDVAREEVYDWCLKIMRELCKKVNVIDVSAMRQV